MANQTALRKRNIFQSDYVLGYGPVAYITFDMEVKHYSILTVTHTYNGMKYTWPESLF